jgi:hypothetical protein
MARAQRNGHHAAAMVVKRRAPHGSSVSACAERAPDTLRSCGSERTPTAARSVGAPRTSKVVGSAAVVTTGLLRKTNSGELCALEAEHIVGRSPRASLRADQGFVSSQHACIRWVAGRWELKDLGSRNGTMVNGVPLKPGEPWRLEKGDRVSFGDSAETWELVDDSPPKVMILPLDAPAHPIVVEGDMIAIPSSSDPKATVFCGADGQWRLEREDDVVSLSNGHVFVTGGRHFRFSVPEIAETRALRDNLARAHLQFRVTKSWEEVHLQVQVGNRRYDLGSRVIYYPLFLLARHRLTDVAQHLPESACGWVYQDELLEELRDTPEYLNTNIFRIRQEFAAVGFADPASIIERRPGTKQLRMGTASLSIEIV